LHLLRIMITCIHELFAVINSHQDVLAHPFFGLVIKQLDPESRRYWESLIAVAQDATPKDDFGHLLLRIRNKVMSHYDPKDIYTGYKRHFLHPKRVHDRAFVSRGNSMNSSRFYFADAAVEGYLKELLGESEFQDLSIKLRDIVGSLNFALRGVVDRFIQKRGFGYRTV
jgi:hypothetical protein